MIKLSAHWTPQIIHHSLAMRSKNYCLSFTDRKMFCWIGPQGDFEPEIPDWTTRPSASTIKRDCGKRNWNQSQAPSSHFHKVILLLQKFLPNRRNLSRLKRLESVEVRGRKEVKDLSLHRRHERHLPTKREPQRDRCRQASSNCPSRGFLSRRGTCKAPLYLN